MGFGDIRFKEFKLVMEDFGQCAKTDPKLITYSDGSSYSLDEFYKDFIVSWLKKDLGLDLKNKHDLRALSFRNKKLRPNTDFCHKDLRGVDFRDSDVSEGWFIGSKMTGALYNKQTRFPDDFDPKKEGMVLI